MSRRDAVFYCYNPHAEPTVMISISDPHMQYAAAFLKHISGDDSSIFENGLYDPNMWCYRKTLEVLS